jgi:dTDP-4-amino-4,6-dideoxygalactose transaminase
MSFHVPFHQVTRVGSELDHLREALAGVRFSGEGVYCEKVQNWLKEYFQAPLVVLTPSCTAALEMACMLLDLQPGDEVILPSFTFTSTALAVVSRRAVPVFVDIRPDDLCLDPELLSGALTSKTKAILPVHYAGISADMSAIGKFAQHHGLYVLEDAAQAMFSKAAGGPVGKQGDLSAFSFHDTKNISCGEGGALVVNQMAFTERAHFLRDKGTNRRKFLHGEVDRYTWVDEGSSFLLSEFQAAVLWAQLQAGQKVTETRVSLWRRYLEGLGGVDARGLFQLPKVHLGKAGNGHLFYILMKSPAHRDSLRNFLFSRGVTALSHYEPLHNAPAGKKFGRAGSNLNVTEQVASTLLRLPLFSSLSEEAVDGVVNLISEWARQNAP